MVMVLALAFVVVSVNSVRVRPTTDDPQSMTHGCREHEHEHEQEQGREKRVCVLHCEHFAGISLVDKASCQTRLRGSYYLHELYSLYSLSYLYCLYSLQRSQNGAPMACFVYRPHLWSLTLLLLLS